MLQDRITWWTTKGWILVGLALSGALVLTILLATGHWPASVLLTLAVAALTPLHVLEEWVFPGGFHFHYNTILRSDRTDRYPMNRLSDLLTNSIATVFCLALGIVGAFTGPSDGIVAGLGIFAVEVVGHTAFGIIMLRRFRQAGKQTIYAPGSITAYFGFFVLAVLCFREIGSMDALDWLTAVGIVLSIVVVCILIPENALKRTHADRYPYANAGYYEQYLNPHSPEAGTLKAFPWR